jgi:serine protease Do
MQTNDRGSGRSGFLRIAALGAGVAAVFIAIALAVGTTQSGGWDEQSTAREQRPESRSAALPVAAVEGAERDRASELPDVDALSRTFAAVAEELKPAVVNIFTQQSATAVQPRTGSPFDEFFERFFREQPGPRRSLGSGVIIDSRGYLVTNHHVVENAEEIEVQFSDERRFDAELVGSDPPTDLAVLRIKTEGGETFPHVDFGDSDALVVGEWVLAMGNPFGFGHTVTAGIVSAKGRVIGQTTYDDFIQTDAAINPGNSGGPLVNMKGNVVGINSNIISNSGGNMGIGFAIPANMAKSVFDQLVADGAVTRGWLGVGIQSLTPDLARGFGLEGKKGALVNEILGDDAPAGKAGLKAGDVIVEFNGVPIDSSSHLVRLVAEVRPGDTVKLAYYRDGERREADVTVTKRTIDTEIASAETTPEGDRGRLGISGQTLTAELAEEIGCSSKSGVVLVDIDPDGPAQDGGLRRGDIIIEANRQPVRSVDDLSRLIADVPSRGDLLLRIERVAGGRSSFLWIPVRLD